MKSRRARNGRLLFAWAGALTINLLLVGALLHGDNAYQRTDSRSVIVTLIPSPVAPRSSPRSSRSLSRPSGRIVVPPPSITPAPFTPKPLADAAPKSGVADRPVSNLSGLTGCSEHLRAYRSDREEAKCRERWVKDNAYGDNAPPAALALKGQDDLDAQARIQKFQRERPLARPFVPCKGPGSNFSSGCLQSSEAN